MSRFEQYLKYLNETDDSLNKKINQWLTDFDDGREETPTLINQFYDNFRKIILNDMPEMKTKLDRIDKKLDRIYTMDEDDERIEDIEMKIVQDQETILQKYLKKHKIQRD